MLSTRAHDDRNRRRDRQGERHPDPDGQQHAVLPAADRRPQCKGAHRRPGGCRGEQARGLVDQAAARLARGPPRHRPALDRQPGEPGIAGAVERQRGDGGQDAEQRRGPRQVPDALVTRTDAGLIQRQEPQRRQQRCRRGRGPPRHPAGQRKALARRQHHRHLQDGHDQRDLKDDRESMRRRRSESDHEEALRRQDAEEDAAFRRRHRQEVRDRDPREPFRELGHRPEHTESDRGQRGREQEEQREQPDDCRQPGDDERAVADRHSCSDR